MITPIDAVLAQRERYMRFTVSACVLLAPSLAWAANDTNGTAGVPLFIAFAIAYLSRRRAIGGWLLYYYLQLYVGLIAFVILFAAHTFRYFTPSAWENWTDYTFFLLSTAPIYLATCADALFSTLVLFRRDLRHVRYVRLSLAALVAAALIALLIDAVQFQNYVSVDIITLSVALIWTIYFFRSHRIRWVLVENRWDYEQFIHRFGTPRPEKLAAGRRKGLIVGIVTFVVLAVLFAIAGRAEDLVNGVITAALLAALIGAIVQYIASKPEPRSRTEEVPTTASTPLVTPSGEADNQYERQRQSERRILNWKQRLILAVIALLAITALLFPPFVIQLGSGQTYNSGYAFLFSGSMATVNTGLLALELVVIGLVGGIGLLLTKDNQR